MPYRITAPYKRSRRESQFTRREPESGFKAFGRNDKATQLILSTTKASLQIGEYRKSLHTLRQFAI